MKMTEKLFTTILAIVLLIVILVARYTEMMTDEVFFSLLSTVLVLLGLKTGIFTKTKK